MHWAGWTGTKSWHAVDGELRIDATSTQTGLLKFDVVASADGGGRGWQLNVRVVIEAGQIDRVAAAAERFFAALPVDRAG